MVNPFTTQVGGNHYTKLAIQPMQYSMANNLDACQHSIVKYITRFRDKDGIADLQKIKHIADMLISIESKKLGIDPKTVDADAPSFSSLGEMLAAVAKDIEQTFSKAASVPKDVEDEVECSCDACTLHALIQKMNPGADVSVAAARSSK